MQYRRFGGTGLDVSVLSYGAAPLGEEYGKVRYKEAYESVHYAIDSGVNLFDVAPYYGEFLAEKRLGRILEKRRKEIILETKVGRYKKGAEEYFDFSEKGIRDSVERSLRYLKTDYIDILLAHDIEFVPKKVILAQALPVMEKLKEEGKVRFTGISSYMLYIIREVATQFPVDVILSYSRYNLTDTSLNDVISDSMIEGKIGLINASPLNMGLLTSRGVPAWHPAPEIVVERVLKATRICRERNTSIEQVALRFALDNGLPSTTLVGMNKLEYVKANLRALNSTIQEETMAEVVGIIKSVRNFFWREGIPENYDPGCYFPDD